jgi:hypothetical protein
MKKRKIDAERLRRAVHLDVRADGEGAWVVTGGAAPHRVTELWGMMECNCADRAIRRTRCKHLLAWALATGHPAALRGLREVVGGGGVARGPKTPEAET